MGRYRTAIPRAPIAIGVYALLVAAFAWYVWSAPFGPGQNGVAVDNSDWISRTLLVPGVATALLFLVLRLRRRA